MMRSQVIVHGDCNTFGTMMELMLDIFEDVVDQCLLIYINDMIIYSKIYEEHVTDLKKVLQ